MSTPKHPEKRSELRAAPASAPPQTVKGPARDKSSRVTLATEWGDARTQTRAPSVSAIDRAEELLRQKTIEERRCSFPPSFLWGCSTPRVDHSLVLHVTDPSGWVDRVRQSPPPSWNFLLAPEAVCCGEHIHRSSLGWRPWSASREKQAAGSNDLISPSFTTPS
jgi:hypothetical protein